MQLDAANHDWDRLFAVMAKATLTPAEADRPAADRPHPHLARAITGCNHARAALLREHEDAWYRFCLSLLGNADDARDATQETALRFLRRLASYRSDASLKTWSFSIALNVCREHRRRRRWLVLPAGWNKADAGPGPDDNAQLDEQTQRLYRVLARLPRRQREAVTLRYLHQLDTGQTAKVMRCAPGTVKATLAKALTTLRRHWEGHDER